MASTIIRNLLNNNIDKVIVRAKSEVKKESKKEITKLREDIPSPEDLKEKLITSACSVKAQSKIENIFNKNKSLLDKLNNRLKQSKEKLTELDNKLNKVRDIIDKIKEKTGLALRFPKFTGKIRTEKNAEDASTDEEVIALYKSQKKSI